MKVEAWDWSVACIICTCVQARLGAILESPYCFMLVIDRTTFRSRGHQICHPDTVFVGCAIVQRFGARELAYKAVKPHLANRVERSGDIVLYIHALPTRLLARLYQSFGTSCSNEVGVKSFL